MRVADRFEVFVQASHPSRISVPTGRTPQPWYDELVRRQADLSHIELFLLDEFGDIPPDHPARCERMLRRDLIDRIANPPHLQVMKVDAVDLGSELDAYDASVRRGGLDLVVLGLGANGHVALNEPGSERDSPTRRVHLAETTRAAAGGYGTGLPPPKWGVTLGMQPILAAGEIWLLVTGSSKAAILREATEGDIGPAVPASLLRTHSNAIALVDEPAAGAL